jgi:hydroxyethylthiazole kinase-like uncharacterized protein yjeF
MSSTESVLTHGLLRSWPLPELGSSKYDRGAVLVVGGASGTPGAVMLAGLAALRVGAGRLTLGVAEPVAGQVATALPESGVVALPATATGSVRGDALDALASHVEAADVVVLGPGLDDPDTTAALVDDLAASAGSTCVVLDAFCLGVLADREDARRRLAGHAVLTPNRTEAELLLGRDDVPSEGLAASVAEEYDAVVTCGGHVADPAGNQWTLSTGRPGLATSGSGDVLAGAVAGLVGRGADPGQATAWATYLHAAAGDRLAAHVGPVGYLARELVDELPRVMVEIGS